MKILQSDIIKEFKENGRRHYTLECKNCGDKFTMRQDYVSIKKECICKKCSKIKSSATHGKSLLINKKRNRIYNIWSGIKSRCNSKSNTNYKYYGGRGITICDEWKNDFMAFYNWCLKNGYNEDLTIDREKNDGNYEPDNCRWSTKCTQSRNIRTIRSNNTTGFKGVIFRKDRKKYYSRIQVNYKTIAIGASNCAIDCAIMYNNYIDEHNLEHSKNIV